MHTYEQSSGRWIAPDGQVIGMGYSGRQPDGKNKPEMQSEHNVGPIPTGKYRIGPPIDTVTHGAFVLPLSPDLKNQMYGRYGFLCHGDSVVNPGAASQGCIIQSRDVREFIWKSCDLSLEVVSGLPVVDLDGEIAT